MLMIFTKVSTLCMGAWLLAACNARQAPLSWLPAANHSLPALPPELNLLSTSVPELQAFLNNGSLTSVQLVRAYLTNIERDNVQGLELRAFIQTAPAESVLRIAQQLDNDRKAGKIRGDLHGIPILVKDNIATDRALGMETTAGNLALKESKVSRDAYVIEALRSAGAIILGKTNLSELAGWKGVLRAFKSDSHPYLDLGSHSVPAYRSPTNGWSAVGGQTSSAYVEGGFDAGSDPMGSSSGSAVALSAGWAAASIGTDTMGSVLGPAARADLYAIRPTVGRVSRSGVVPVSLEHDTVGPMGFTTYDVALLLEIMAGADERDPYTLDRPNVPKYTQYATYPSPLSSFKLGIPAAHFLHDPSFRTPQACVSETAEAFNKTVSIMEHLGTEVEWNTDIDLEVSEVAEFLDAFTRKVNGDFRVDMEAYLQDLKKSKVRSMVDLIEFNDLHSNATALTQKYANEKGFGGVFDRYPDLDLLVIPFALGMPGIWMGAGQFPAGVVPMGYCSSGLPFGMMFIARRWQEHRLVEIMAAYEKEASLPSRRPPPLLTNGAQ